MQKIKIVKQSHQVESSAGNPHNSYLDSKEAQFLKNQQNTPLNFSIVDNVIEWYIRTLADEIYKLAFINDKKFYKIKMFWPSEFDQFEQYKNVKMDIENQNTQNQNNQIQDPISYYFSQFDGFEIEDYFDVIIMPKLNKTSKELKLKVFFNSFTYITSKRNYSQVKGLELFYEEDLAKLFIINKENDFSILAELTNLIIKKCIFRQEVGIDQFEIQENDLRKRIIPILNEETRVLLYELYKDL